VALDTLLAKRFYSHALGCSRAAQSLVGLRGPGAAPSAQATLVAESVQFSLLALALLKAEEVSEFSDLPRSLVSLGRQIEKAGVRVFEGHEAEGLATLDAVHLAGPAKVLLPDDFFHVAFSDTYRLAERLVAEVHETLRETGGLNQHG
jgi:hypothetical protein